MPGQDPLDQKRSTSGFGLVRSKVGKYARSKSADNGYSGQIGNASPVPIVMGKYGYEDTVFDSGQLDGGYPLRKSVFDNSVFGNHYSEGHLSDTPLFPKAVFVSNNPFPVHGFPTKVLEDEVKSEVDPTKQGNQLGSDEYEKKLAEIQEDLAWRKRAFAMKFLSVIFNLFFVSLALGLLIGSVLILCTSRVWFFNLEGYAVWSVAAVFSLGTTLLTVSSLGLYGALKPHIFALAMYTVFVLPVIAGGVLVSVISWKYTESVGEGIVGVLFILFTSYDNPENETGVNCKGIIDTIQNFGCCGGTGGSDWLKTGFSPAWQQIHPSGIPVSCCTLGMDDSPYERNGGHDECTEPRNIHQMGCNDFATETMLRNLSIVASAWLVLACCQAIILIFNFILYLRKRPDVKRNIRGKMGKVFANKSNQDNYP